MQRITTQVSLQIVIWPVRWSSRSVPTSRNSRSHVLVSSTDSPRYAAPSGYFWWLPANHHPLRKGSNQIIENMSPYLGSYRISVVEWILGHKHVAGRETGGSYLPPESLSCTTQLNQPIKVISYHILLMDIVTFYWVPCDFFISLYIYKYPQTNKGDSMLLLYS